MSSDGDTVIIGDTDNDGGAFNSGHARIFDWDGTIWVQRGADIDGEAFADQTGHSDGNTVIIAAVNNDAATGNVRIYDWII